jgi:uncharacterized protein YyaL (SSP411 family)
MATTTLNAMRRGGIWDHVGLGFHRYSTDREWLVPHFEKMLYDQAMLLLAYTEAYVLESKQPPRQRDHSNGSGPRMQWPGHGEVIRELVTYVLRDMTAPEGGFYSAEDADSEGVEGKHYVWTLAELEQALGEHDAALAARVWNVSPEGNFHDEATGRRTGASILHLGSQLIDEPESIESIRQRLHAARSKRVFPLKDDKILADWNGLMSAALARAGAALDEPAWVEAAERAVDRVLELMRDASGRLLHCMRGEERSVPAFLDDHVFLTWALIELHQATLEPRHLERAVALQKETLARFWDHEQGGLFFTAEDSEPLLVRQKEHYDGAIPSGSSVALSNLLSLSRLTGDMEMAARADELARAAAVEVLQAPAAHTHLLDAFQVASERPLEIVIAGDPESEDTRRLLQVAREHALPGALLLLVAPGSAGELVRSLAPFTHDHLPIEGRAAAYVCRNNECRLPTNDPQALEEMLDDHGRGDDVG